FCYKHGNALIRYSNYVKKIYLLIAQGGESMIYSQRLLHFFYEIAYLIHIERQKGFLHMAETADLDRFEEKLRPMMRRSLDLLKTGPTPEKARIYLDIHKIEYWTNPAYNCLDLKLIQICLEACLILQRTDWDDLRFFANENFLWDGNEED